MGDRVKIEIGEEEITLFLRKNEIENFDFEDIDEVEDYFRTLFLKLEEFYNIVIEGFYNIHVFLDKNEGMVLKLEKEDIDYYHAFHQVEMRIVKEDTLFLYQVDDVLNFLRADVDIYVYKDQFYLQNRKKKEEYSLYEFGRLIYENTDNILKQGVLLTEK